MKTFEREAVGLMAEGHIAADVLARVHDAPATTRAAGTS